MSKPVKTDVGEGIETLVKAVVVIGIIVWIPILLAALFLFCAFVIPAVFWWAVAHWAKLVFMAGFVVVMTALMVWENS